ncbi:MAG: hypothetical protein IH988_00240 [Planctomycetes bacterium]|nr:hypothetical protein [Planctomycetota bacterium]
MANPIPAPDRLRQIKTFPSLVKYLRDDLDWPIESDDFDELTFDYEPEELGLDAKAAVKIKQIKQLRPLADNQPWGIFFINFEPRRLPVVALRRILRSLVIKKRQSANRPQQAAWQLHDLLFISSYGEADHRDITFAHFSENADHDGGLPTLRVLGWDDEDTVLHLEHAHATLKEKLCWPEDDADLDAWRSQWSSAFTLRHREVINTSKALAVRMAQLASAIRKRANQVLSVESDKGPLRKLMSAFKEALIHDLSDDDFADMYAQTITYGLLTARVSRPTGLVADNLTDMVPITNPFLKELMDTFLNIGGRHNGTRRESGIDFDELGVNDVVDTLRAANMEAVLRDFGDKNPQEDPVIHFYEDFLKEYDAKKRMQRGVFYTPRPVVSFIVRYVDELLRTEFGLEDGLADTTTWGEMPRKRKPFKLPEIEFVDPKTRKVSKRPIDPAIPFVQILDPATGTATFLVEVIDIIHKTMVAKWQQQGHTEMFGIPDLWNEYVPKYLLPRLHGYELMMAPYAIAHMKIGLKLFETGYRFESDERARVYLTNSLEPPQDFSGTLAFAIPALAHEAEAVNAIKRDQRFTVVIGNPPYSKLSSNLTPEMRATVERYRYVDGVRIKERGALQFEINLQDDYVKFFRFCEGRIRESNVGTLGLITNNGYLSTPTLRGMRNSLLETFRSIWVLDLHGHLAKGEMGPDGAKEENVFDIVQGVSLFLGACMLPETNDSSVFHAECYGSREGKYSFLQSKIRSSARFSTLEPLAPFYLFVPHDADLAQEWKQYVGLAELFPKNSAGIITARDGLVLSEKKRELAIRLERFSHADGVGNAIYEEYGFSKSKRFDLREAQSQLRKLNSFNEPIRQMLHRPFDERFIFYHASVVWSLSRPMANQMIDGKNLALVATRQVTRPQFEHAFVSRHIIEIKSCSHDRNTQIFPLFIRWGDDELPLSSGMMPNLNTAILTRFSCALGLKLSCNTGNLGIDNELTPLRLFHFVYAVLHCPSYRERYFEFLRSDFPRLPLTGDLVLFHALSRFGSELVALHLLESPLLEKHVTKLSGAGDFRVEKVSYSDETVWIDKEKTHGFRRVPEEVWNFHIGGYQVCEKWLKDRQAKGGKNPRPGRVLTDEDIDHYQKIVVALSETIRIMAEIDEVIEAHGGWPGAFITEKTAD